MCVYNKRDIIYNIQHHIYILNIYNNDDNAEVKELAASNWISTTCRDIQTAIIKTCAYNNRFALKCAFGESYNELYPGTIAQFILPAFL